MQAFYNPTTQARVNTNVLYVEYGITPETAVDNGWYPFDISPPAYDRRFFHPVEKGVVESDQPGVYRIDWDLLPNAVEPAKTKLKDELAAVRFNYETDGLIINGATILTDRDSQASVALTKSGSDMDPDAVVNWKSATGWVTIDRATIIALATAVFRHKQQCFTHEMEVSQLIDAAETIEDLVAIAADLQKGWPETAGVNASAQQNLMSVFAHLQ